MAVCVCVRNERGYLFDSPGERFQERVPRYDLACQEIRSICKNNNVVTSCEYTDTREYWPKGITSQLRGTI